MEGFVQIRRGLAEHLETGKLNAFQFLVYMSLHMRANFETGIYKGTALGIAHQIGYPRDERHVQAVLASLKKKRYINYPRGVGARGGYQMLIHKYEPTVGRWFGYRLNAWKHGAACRPEYERVTANATVPRLNPGAAPSEPRPNKEIRSKNEDKPKSEFENRSNEELIIMRNVHITGGAKLPPSLEEELKRRGIPIITECELKALEAATSDEPATAVSIDRIEAAAVGSFGKNRVGKKTVRELQAAYAAYARRIFRAKLHPELARLFRLQWASTNCGHAIFSFSQLTYKQAKYWPFSLCDPCRAATHIHTETALPRTLVRISERQHQWRRQPRVRCFL